MKIYNPKVLTTALSAGVFALGSFAAMNAYADTEADDIELFNDTFKNLPMMPIPQEDNLATGACLVCWSPDSTLCEIIDDSVSSPDPAIVMWMSCYERNFRSGYGAVNKASCDSAPGNYSTAIPHPPEKFPNPNKADASWWFAGETCKDVRTRNWVPEYVPRAADPLTYTPICLVNNAGSDNVDVAGVGELAPGGTGLLNGVCPTN